MRHIGQTTHGGQSFEAIGEDFRTLERGSEVVNADVLDAWFDPSPRVIERLHEFLPFLLRTSPPVDACGLVNAIANARCIPADCILPGGGSSDLIFACLPRLASGAKSVLILDPTYGEYQHVFENVLKVETKLFDLQKQDQFRVDTDRLISCVRGQQPDLVGLVNPNSPTGQHWPRREVVRFLDSVPGKTCVLIDETYIEYAGRQESLETEACARPNVLVLKSMSKVYALSGARVGYLVANAASIRSLAGSMPPWSVSLLAQVAAVEALADPEYYQRRYEETHALRESLACDLERIGSITVYPSVTNFLLIEVPSSAQQIVDRMRGSNVFVRNCDSMSVRFEDRFLRIAVKSEPQNRRIVEALAAAV
jgi:histidinol-phosphate/aromatic aminotransferase/cobyric acid decarboxylase-like protein